MTEGTKSYLIGCHQFFMHPLLVLIAWRKRYKKWPRLWQLACIFLHDIGVVGTNYLNGNGGKKDHWIKGAYIAYALFGEKGLLFCAGHTNQSKYPRSKLYYADKQSWLYAPDWWLDLNYKIEDFRSQSVRPRIWKQIVSDNIKNGFAEDCHDLYLKHRREHEK